jgi:NADPH:quinone reductase-like Zn-dependent oxidoreductase
LFLSPGPLILNLQKKSERPGFPKLIMQLLSAGARRKAKRRNVSFSFLFMRAQGNQLSQITSLIDAGIIRPVIDKVFAFEKTNEALAYVETGRARGKVVVKIK